MRKVLFKSLVIPIVIFTILWFNYTFFGINLEEFRHWILSFGPFAPLLYIVFYTFRPFVFFPASVFTIVGGLAFGLPYGIIFALIGATSGAALSYFVARKIRTRFIIKKWTGVASRIEKQLEDRGFFYILILRLMPFIHFDLLSYISGISNVRFKPYFFATFFGIIPGTVAYNLLGASFVEQNPLTMITAVFLFCLLILVPIFLRRKWTADLDV